ncbi:MAG: hypothetical protein KJP00_13215, partial [Bacteroidia bacterium]|nr:hypothetical protein [Bacteroidia bacterium]
MNTRIIYIIFFLVLVRMADGQEKQNLIPNPGFESFSAYPVGWFYTGKHFSNVVKYWSSPTAASPDAYGPNIFVPTFWKDKGFGMADPHSGAAMAGITVYGCQDGKPHCREYIQTPLIEPLVVGQRYGFSMWIRKLESGFDIKSFGVSFTFDKTYI